MKNLLRNGVLVGSLVLASITQADVSGITGGKQLQAAAEKQITNISTADLQGAIESQPSLVLIDIRTPGEVKGMGGAIDAAQNINIPRGWLEFRVTKAAQDKDTPIVVYCGANVRSPLAAETLQQMGYTNVKNYADGYLGWKKAGLPIAAPK